MCPKHQLLWGLRWVKWVSQQLQVTAHVPGASYRRGACVFPRPDVCGRGCMCNLLADLKQTEDLSVDRWSSVWAGLWDEQRACTVLGVRECGALYWAKAAGFVGTCCRSDCIGESHRLPCAGHSCFQPAEQRAKWIHHTPKLEPIRGAQDTSLKIFKKGQ